MTLRPSIQIDAATRYCLDRQITFDKPVCLLDSSLIRKLPLPTTTCPKPNPSTTKPLKH